MEFGGWKSWGGGGPRQQSKFLQAPHCCNLPQQETLVVFSSQQASKRRPKKMLHTNQAEMNMLYDSFCRLWANGSNASLSTTCSGGKVTAKLEVELGKPSEPRPGAPRRRTATPLSTQGTQASGAPRRKTTHRGPAAKAKSLARAVAYQASRTAASGGTASVPPSTSAPPPSSPPPQQHDW